MNVLEATDLTVRFGGVTALDGVSLTLEEGITLGLVGPNGAGKTTLLDTVSGFVRPASGAVSFAGRDVSRLQPWRRTRLGLARTFQATELFEDLTIRENLQVAGAPDALVGDLIARLDLGDYQQTIAGDVPAGVGRLASIARAMTTQPRVLLLDEPGAGLVPDEKRRLAEILRGLIASHELSIVLIDHDMSFIGDACSDVVVLDFGKVIATGPPEQIQRDPRVQEAYLGV